MWKRVCNKMLITLYTVFNKKVEIYLLSFPHKKVKSFMYLTSLYMY